MEHLDWRSPAAWLTDRATPEVVEGSRATKLPLEAGKGGPSSRSTRHAPRPKPSRWWAATTTRRPAAPVSAARSESTISRSASAGQSESGSCGFGPVCSHHWVSSSTSRSRFPMSTTSGPGQPPRGRSVTAPPPAESMNAAWRLIASQPSAVCLAQSWFPGTK